MKKIGLLKEPDAEDRVLLLPEGVKKLLGMDYEVLVETGAGEKIFAADQDYVDAGAEIRDRNGILQDAEILVGLTAPDMADEKPTEKQVLIAVLNPLSNLEIVKSCVTGGFTAFSLDSIPRITRAQSMDILSSMSTIAGYRAVLLGATHLPRFFPMLMTAAGTIPPAKVLVIGAGVAGLQAIATARRLGAVVSAFDTRTSTKEQVESLGGKFVEVEGAVEDVAAGGYAVEQGEDFKKRQAEAIAKHAAASDIVITTALIPGRKAPILITADTVKKMPAASVIVDLAGPAGGNCELSVPGETVVREQTTILAPLNISGEMAGDASRMLNRNLLDFLKILRSEDGEIAMDDEIVAGTCICRAGEIVNERVKSVIEQENK